MIMTNNIFEMFYYLENHIGWKIKVHSFDMDSICYLKNVVPFEYIEVSLNNKKYKYEFSNIESLDISCQEGFYIRIYEKSNIIKKELYNIFKLKKLEEKNKYSNLFDNSMFFSNKSKVYLFSNEPNIWKIINVNNLKNKKIFSIIGSGDFFFSTCLLGTKEFDLVDINKYANDYFEIKKAMIEKYNYDEFLSIYKDITNIFDSFNEYKEYLPLKIREEITNNFKQYSNDKSDFMKNIFWSDSYLFNNSINIYRRLSFIKYHNNYLSNENNYNRLKKILKEVKYKSSVSSIFDFDFNNKYDYIYLSNIGDYYEPDIFNNLLLKIGKENNNGRIILIYRTDNYKQLLNNNNFNIDMIEYNDNTSLNNIILICYYKGK